MTSTQQPEWGRLIQTRREQQGRSIRQAALIADLSDAYWGQVEKGYVSVKGTRRPVVPSRRALLAIADSLRMSPKQTTELLEAVGHKGYVPEDARAPRESEVDLTGLSRRDIALLNVLADRFRGEPADVQADRAGALRDLRAGRKSARPRPAPNVRAGE